MAARANGCWLPNNLVAVAMVGSRSTVQSTGKGNGSHATAGNYTARGRNDDGNLTEHGPQQRKLSGCVQDDQDHRSQKQCSAQPWSDRSVSVAP